MNNVFTVKDDYVYLKTEVAEVLMEFLKFNFITENNLNAKKIRFLYQFSVSKSIFCEVREVRVASCFPF